MYISKATTTIQGMPLHEARNQSRLRRKASSANEPELYIMSQQKKSTSKILRIFSPS